MKFQNAEFQRNFWLEFSFHRIVATPIILGTFFYIAGIKEINPNMAIFGLSAFLFVAIVCIWGAHRTADSMVSEIQERTWISQRLTPTNPWSMVWAKLFGSSIAAWYGGVFCLIAFFITGANLENQELKWALISQGLLPGAFYLIGTAIACQVIGFMIGFGGTEERKSLAVRRSFVSNGAGGIIGISCLILSFKKLELNATILWYGIPFAEFYFWIFSLYSFLAWGLISLYSQMRREFQMPNHPLVWVTFLAFISIYIFGFEFESTKESFGDRGPIFFRSSLSFFSMLILAYLMIVWEKTDGFALRQLFGLIKRGQFKKTIYKIPRWTLSVLSAWVLGIWLIIAFGTESAEWSIDMYQVVGAILCFAMRDLGLILYFRLSAKPHRATAVAILYLFILYGLMPALTLTSISEEFVYVFYPISSETSALKAIFPPFLEAVLMWILTMTRWKRSPNYQLT